VQLANCILLHAYSRTAAAPGCASTHKTSNNLVLSWYNSIFDDKLRSD